MSRGGCRYEQPTRVRGERAVKITIEVTVDETPTDTELNLLEQQIRFWGKTLLLEPSEVKVTVTASK